MSDASPESVTSSNATFGGPSRDKGNDKEIRRRSRNACDACRARKIKCVDSGASHCVACTALNIQCTYNRPKKRRGPPNLYVQAQVQGQLHGENSPSSSTWITASPAQDNQPFHLSDLGPPCVIENIINDWFELIYSVCPMLHHGIFIARLARGDADTDLEFASVVVAVCAATIASLRQNSHYGDITVLKCLDAIERIEVGLGGTRRMFSLEWCQMKYNLSVAVLTERGVDDELAFRFMSESVMGVKYLIYHRLGDLSYTDQQLLKRLYWLVFAGQCTIDLHSRPSIGLLSPQDNIESLYPLSLSDQDLDPTFTFTSLTPSSYTSTPPWHGHNRSYIPGLNQLSKLFLIWHSSQQRPFTSATSSSISNQLTHLQAHSQQIQRALDYLPPELQWRGGLSQPPSANFGTQVQTANLYITQLHIRSNLLEQMNQLSKKQSDTDAATPLAIVHERQSIVDDMLEILYHMPDETLRANGHSLIPKIRDVGGALLDEVRTGDRPVRNTGDNEGGGSAANCRAAVNLERLLVKLQALDVHSRRVCL